MNPPNYISPHFQKVHYPSSSIRDFRAAEGFKENRISAPVHKQKIGFDKKTNFMSYPHYYYRINSSSNDLKELQRTYKNPEKATGNQLGALIRYYSKGLLNKDNR